MHVAAELGKKSAPAHERRPR